MNDLRSWLARLTMVGLCMAWIGCGGSDVPDPGADAQAANEAPAVDSAPAAPAAKDEGEVVAKNDDPAPAPAEAAPAAAAAGEDKSAEEKLTAATKGDSSGTTELFNLANNAPPPPDVAAPADAAAPTPGGPGGPGGPRGMGGPGMMQPGMSPGQMAGGPPDPRMMGGGQRGPGGMAGMPGMPPGGRGGPGMGMGMSGADNAPADYTLPIGAVTAFLNAVKAKDKDRIAEATALRSTTEAHSDGMKKLFSRILDQSVSDDDVAEIAKQLEGYTIIGMNDAHSSGRQGIILGKSTRTTQIRRTITVRHEAKGWKVVDISGQSDVMGNGNGRTGTKGGVRAR
jgi:hypothetical protein